MNLTTGDIIYHLLKYPVMLYLKLKFNIKVEHNPLKEVKGPYLLLGHHVTAFDPIISNLFSRRLIRYVTADANYDSKLKRFFLNLVEGIPFTKNAADSSAIRRIMRHIKKGHPVGLYPEGGRNWDGSTDFIIPSTAKLVKLLRVPVYAIFYKGGYLSKPRWAYHFRKGIMSVEIREIISEDAIARKSIKDIYKTLVEKLDYNEFEWQKNQKIPFRGKRLAEDIERLIYLCPECHTINSIISRGNHFYCKSCGKEHSINEYGIIEGSSHFEDTVAWNKWQMSLLPEIIEKGLSFSNPQISLEKIELQKRRKMFKVLLVLDPDKIIIEYSDRQREIIPLQDISGLSITFLDMVEFFVDETKYRFTFDPKKHMSVKLFYDLLAGVKEDK
ncbi:MAG: lysophospholipid acyltransferase family protein [Halanaerobiales bacterium]